MAGTARKVLLWRALSASIGIALAACGEKASVQATDSYWDEAGIEVVDVAAVPSPLSVDAATDAATPRGNAAAPTMTPHWATDTEPYLRVGVAEGEPEYVFGSIGFATRFSDGGLLVVDGQRGQLRFYDSGGAFLSQVGEIGEGPNSFRSTAFRSFERKLFPMGTDSILIYDDGLRRITTVQADGVINQVGIPTLALTDGMGRKIVGTLADTAFVYVLSSGSSVSIDRRAIGDTLRNAINVVIRSAEGEERTITTLPGGLLAVVEVQRDATTTVKGIWSMPLAHTVLAVARGDRIVASRTDRYEFMFFDRTGELERVVRRTDIVPVVIDDKVLSRYEVPTSSGMNMDGFIRPWPAMPFEKLRGSHLSTHSALLLDDEGNLWVRGPSFPWDEEEPTEWAVYSATGEFLATASLPRGLDVYQVGKDFVVGRLTDEWGVDSAGVFRLHRR